MMRLREIIFVLFSLSIAAGALAEQTAILSLTANPNPFSPNADSLKDEVLINFRSSHPWSYWQIVVHDTNLSPIRSFSGIISNDNLDVSVTWDGRDANGGILSDGDYDYDIDLFSDIIPPTSGMTVYGPQYPLPDGFIVDAGTIFQLNSYDPVVDGFASGLQRIEYTVSTTNTAGSGEWRPYSTGFVLGEPDGVYTLSYRSVDMAGNVEPVHTARVVLDASTPVVRIGGVVDGAYYNHGVRITVEILEAILKNRRIIINGELVDGNTIDIADEGSFVLTVQAEDMLGRITQRSVRFEIDTTPPEIGITSPPSFAMVNGSVSIVGSISDRNFDGYKIEYFGVSASGLIRESASGVIDSLLGVWETPGLPEGNYSIVVTAWDKAGNSRSLTLSLYLHDLDFLASFGTAKDMNKPMFIARDKKGDLYVSDENNKAIRKYTASGVFIREIIGDLDQPQGVAVDDSGNIYVSGHHSLLKFDSAGNRIWEKEGLNQPAGIKIFKPEGSASDRVYVADRNNDRIVVYTLDGNFIREIATNLNKPMDLALDANGTMYVSDSGNDRIALFDIAGVFRGSFGSCCVGQGYLNGPSGISISSFSFGDFNVAEPLIYVVDSQNDMIKVFDTAGLQLYSFGTHGQGDGQFNKPVGILVSDIPAMNSGSSTVYVADRNNNRVQIFGAPAIVPSAVPVSSAAGADSVKIRNEISYPNPFSPDGDGVNDHAKIRYELSADADVTVKIYNQIGKLVYAFDRIGSGFNGGRAGVNEILWDGLNNAGKRVNNGIYIYHILAKSASGQVAVASDTIVVLK